MNVKVKISSMLSVLAVLLILPQSTAPADITVYDCTPDNNAYNTSFSEVGDDVTLAGTERLVREVTFGYNLVAAEATGNEEVLLRLYDLSDGQPGSVLYESLPIDLNPGYNYYTVTSIDTVVPDTLVWTVAISGYAYEPGGHIYAGPIFANANPTVGWSNDDTIWNKGSGTWRQYDFSDATANLEARITADPVPVPGAALLGILGLGSAVMRLRHKRI